MRFHFYNLIFIFVFRKINSYQVFLKHKPCKCWELVLLSVFYRIASSCQTIQDTKYAPLASHFKQDNFPCSVCTNNINPAKKIVEANQELPAVSISLVTRNTRVLKCWRLVQLHLCPLLHPQNLKMYGNLQFVFNEILIRQIDASRITKAISFVSLKFKI